MSASRRAARGYTLIELLVTVILVGIVLSAGAQLLSATFNHERDYRQQNRAQQSARTAIGTIVDEMKSAIRKDTLVVMGTLRATQPTATVRGTTAGSVDPAAVPSINSHTTPLVFNIYNDDGTTERRVRYWCNGTDLRREIVSYVDETATPQAASSATAGTVIARDITRFTAQKPYDSLSTTSPLANNFNIVKISITATQTDPGGSQSVVTLTTNVTLRNNLL